MRRETTLDALTLDPRYGGQALVRQQFRQPGPVNNETGNVSRSLTMLWKNRTRRQWEMENRKGMYQLG